jgi:hypothetical protein
MMLFFLHPLERSNHQYQGIIYVRKTTVFHDSIRVHSYGFMENDGSLGRPEDFHPDKSHLDATVFQLRCAEVHV